MRSTRLRRAARPRRRGFTACVSRVGRATRTHPGPARAPAREPALSRRSVVRGRRTCRVDRELRCLRWPLGPRGAGRCAACGARRVRCRACAVARRALRGAGDSFIFASHMSVKCYLITHWTHAWQRPHSNRTIIHSSKSTIETGSSPADAIISSMLTNRHTEIEEHTRAWAHQPKHHHHETWRRQRNWVLALPEGTSHH